MPAVPRRKQEERSAETRMRLVKAAIDCLAEHGYERTSTPRIAAMAGVSRGAQTHQFPTKASLMEAVVVHIFDHSVEGLEQAMEGKAAIDDRLEALLGHLWSQTFQGRVAMAMLELMAVGRSDPELRKAIAQQAARRDATLSRAWHLTFGEEAARAEPLANITHAILHGMALISAYHSPGTWAEPMLDEWKNLVLLAMRQS